jgi:hypothetical protein
MATFLVEVGNTSAVALRVVEGDEKVTQCLGIALSFSPQANYTDRATAACRRS